MNDRIEAALAALPNITKYPWNLAVAKINGIDHLAISGAGMKVGDSGPAVCLVSPMKYVTERDTANGIVLFAAPDLAAEVIRLREEVAMLGKSIPLSTSMLVEARDKFADSCGEAKGAKP